MGGIECIGLLGCAGALLIAIKGSRETSPSSHLLLFDDENR